MAKPKKQKRYIYKYAGRQTKLTEETVRKLEDAFGVGANVKQACYYANISRDTFYTWMKENPALSDRLTDVREKLPLQALRNIAIKVQGKQELTGDIGLSKWLLEKRMKKEYGETIRLEDGTDDDDGVPKEDKEVINELHAKLKANLVIRSRKKAIEDGEIKS